MAWCTLLHSEIRIEQISVGNRDLALDRAFGFWRHSDHIDSRLKTAEPVIAILIRSRGMYQAVVRIVDVDH
ncbi:MAG: hypothetical protein O7G86_00940, partial [Gammaproteobacteria bacterium]|nr:hypothetical protein [Gammaproteobacteria bacterium]